MNAQPLKDHLLHVHGSLGNPNPANLEIYLHEPQVLEEFLAHSHQMIYRMTIIYRTGTSWCLARTPGISGVQAIQPSPDKFVYHGLHMIRQDWWIL